MAGEMQVILIDEVPDFLHEDYSGDDFHPRTGTIYLVLMVIKGVDNHPARYKLLLENGERVPGEWLACHFKVVVEEQKPSPLQEGSLWSEDHPASRSFGNQLSYSPILSRHWPFNSGFRSHAN